MGDAGRRRSGALAAAALVALPAIARSAEPAADAVGPPWVVRAETAPDLPRVFGRDAAGLRELADTAQREAEAMNDIAVHLELAGLAGIAPNYWARAREGYRWAVQLRHQADAVEGR